MPGYSSYYQVKDKSPRLEKGESLINTGKIGIGAAAFVGANIGYQKSINLQNSK